MKFKQRTTPDWKMNIKIQLCGVLVTDFLSVRTWISLFDFPGKVDSYIKSPKLIIALQDLIYGFKFLSFTSPVVEGYIYWGGRILGSRVSAFVSFLLYVNVSWMRSWSTLSSHRLTLPAPWGFLPVEWPITRAPPWKLPLVSLRGI